MRISELSRQTGVSTASIKLFIREGLIPPGDERTPRSAVYTDAHAERVEVIRNLRDIAAVPFATIKRLLAAVDSDLPLPALLGLAHAAVVQPVQFSEQDAELAEALFSQLGWRMPRPHPSFGHIAVALGKMRAGEHGTDAATLAPWIDAATSVSDVEVSSARIESRLLLVHDVVVGTHLANELLVHLHMAAQVNRALGGD